MNETENQSNGPGVDELRGQLQSLRVLFAVTLLLVIGLAFCANFYLSRQISVIRTGITQVQAQIDSFPRAAAEDFLAKLKDYAKVHPDFAPIRDKYGPLFGTPHPQSAPPAAVKK